MKTDKITPEYYTKEYMKSLKIKDKDLDELNRARDPTMDKT